MEPVDSVSRVLPRRHRAGPRRLAPDRMDRAGRRPHHPPRSASIEGRQPIGLVDDLPPPPLGQRCQPVEFDVVAAPRPRRRDGTFDQHRSDGLRDLCVEDHLAKLLGVDAGSAAWASNARPTSAGTAPGAECRRQQVRYRADRAVAPRSVAVADQIPSCRNRFEGERGTPAQVAPTRAADQTCRSRQHQPQTSASSTSTVGSTLRRGHTDRATTLPCSRRRNFDHVGPALPPPNTAWRTRHVPSLR